MEKTAYQWLLSLKDEHRDLAICNLFDDCEEAITDSLEDAIYYYCKWKPSPQGEDFWCKIHQDIVDGTYFDAPQLTPEKCEAYAKEKLHGLPDTGGRSEFSTGAVRDASEGKGLPSHLPTRALLRASKRFEDGAAKYDAHNWRKGIPLSRYIDSLNRHTWLFMQGDTSEDHLGAISWNALCLSETFDLISEGKLPQSLNDLPEHQQ